MKTRHIIFYIIYITLAVVGSLLSTHLFFEHIFLRDFYVYYTNLSNYLCLIVVIIALVCALKSNARRQKLIFYIINTGKLSSKNFNYNKLIKKCKKFMTTKRHKLTKNKYYVPYINVMPSWLSGLFFVSGQLIFTTFLVYNILLADFSFAGYWTNLYNLLFHVFLPISFIVCAVINCKTPNIFLPIVPVAIQFAYIGFIYLRSLIVGQTMGRIVYPYFFLNFAALGASGALKWLIIILVVGLITSYLLWLIIFVKKLVQSKCSAKKFASK